MYEKGLPPIAGGALDQAKHFIATARFCWQEKAQLTAEELKRSR